MRKYAVVQDRIDTALPRYRNVWYRVVRVFDTLIDAEIYVRTSPTPLSVTIVENARVGDRIY